MTRDERKEYTEFLNACKKMLRKGAISSVSGLLAADQAYFDASLAEPEDGAFCD